MSIKTVLLSSSLCCGLLLGAAAQASENPFLPKTDAGFLILAEGKCGGAESSSAADANKCDSDMKCGEGKCGDAMMSDIDGADDKCGGASEDKADDGAGAKCGGAQ